MAVTGKNSDQFSVPNLTKYLRMRGVEVVEGATPEETIVINARKLVELLETAGGGPGSRPTPAPVALRHELLPSLVPAQELQGLFPAMKEAYMQQPLDYGRNSRYGDKWRISCYLVVMENWKPKIEAHAPMVECMGHIMDRCVERFNEWHCRRRGLGSVEVVVMNAFVTRYRPIQDENELKRHIDGANVDGSVILALPTDDPFEGGSLHVWDGGKPAKEHEYRMASGDAIFLDNAVWHQAKPITSGTRWALVLFLKLQNATARGASPAA